MVFPSRSCPDALSGRQARLKPDSREKVDLVAQSGSKTWEIELKIQPASGNDLTLVQSYLQDLAVVDKPAARIGGILSAPAFGENVLNAALGDPRVVLMRFLMER